MSFGEPLSDAARKLGGRVESDRSVSGARFVDYPGEQVTISGSLRWRRSGEFRFPERSGREVGSFQAISGDVIFPHHTFIGESLARFRRSLGSGARRERPEHNAAIGYYLVGPHGRTLWAWGSKGGKVQALGLAESLTGARLDWVYEG